MTTREEAIRAAGKAMAEAELGIREGTVEEAARRAYRPGGKSLAELEAGIRAIREADRKRTAS